MGAPRLIPLGRGYASMFGRIVLIASLLAFLTTPAHAADCSASLQSLVDAASAGSTVLVPACVYHENVQINKPAVLDGQNQAIVDGDNTRDRWFWINASNVTLKNFTMRNANSALQEGAIGTQAGVSNVVIDHNDLGATVNGSQVGIGGTTDSKVTNNQIHGGGQLGIETYLNTRLLISGNHVYGNNTAYDDPNFGAGGIKAVSETAGIITSNEVDHNAGPGIWCDIACTGETISGNNVHDQAFNPIFYEISSNGDIYGNTVSASNTNPSGNWGCIVVSSSGDTNVHGNACIDTMPLRAQLDDRNDKPIDAGRNVRLQNNQMVRPVGNVATSWWQFTSTGPLIVGQNGNLDSNNQVTGSIARPTVVPTPAPTMTCQVEVFLGGVSQGRKTC